MSLSNMTSFTTRIIVSNVPQPRDSVETSSVCFGDDEIDNRTVGKNMTDPGRITSATSFVPLFWMEESMNEKSVRFRTNRLVVFATRHHPISCIISFNVV